MQSNKSNKTYIKCLRGWVRYLISHPDFPFTHYTNFYEDMIIIHFGFDIYDDKGIVIKARYDKVDNLIYKEIRQGEPKYIRRIHISEGISDTYFYDCLYRFRVWVETNYGIYLP